MRVAMISYNSFMANENNGWKINGENELLLIQNSSGEKWGAKQGPQTTNELAAGTTSVELQVESNWEILIDSLPKLDAVIFYIGSTGAERAIELAKDHGLDPEKAIFTLCDCGYERKTELINSCGFSSSRIIDCECGGHDSMGHIYNDFLEHGKF